MYRSFAMGVEDRDAFSNAKAVPGPAGRFGACAA